MSRIFSATLAGFLLACAMPAATDVSGKWSGFPIYLTLKQDGNKVTGTTGQTEDDQIPFQDGTIEDDRLVLKFGPMEVTLTVQGDLMTGEVHQGAKTMKIALKRMKPRDPNAPPPAFEAASVKRAIPPPMGKGITSSMKTDPGRLICSNVSLKRYIVAAWGLKDYQVSGPDWIDNERYDITATMPAGTPTGEALSMLRTLLTERFRLSVHSEKKELPVYALVVDKGGLKLKPGDGPESSSMSGGSQGRALKANLTMKGFAGILSGVVDKPVIDMTETAGGFNINLEWTPDDIRAPEGVGGPAPDSSAGPSIFTALHGVGLKLESRKAPVEMLVVDSAEKVPAEN